MLRRLRGTLNEKIKRLTVQQDVKQTEKKLEMSESMNNAIRMVVVNSALNILFKLPQTLVPFENALETFYFQNKFFDCGKTSSCNFGFMSFSHNLRDSRVYYLISDLCEWFLIILISIQLIVYSKFDRNIKVGLDRLLGFSNQNQNNGDKNNKGGNQRRATLYFHKKLINFVYLYVFKFYLKFFKKYISCM